MVAIKLIVLSVACACAYAIPQQPPVTRNTIFADERLEGEIFEAVDAFDNIELTSRNADTAPYRLPTTTRPHHYNILWHINMQDLSYSGNVEIFLSPTQNNVSEIVIHTDHVNLNVVELRLGTTLIPTTYIVEAQYHFLRVRLNNGVLENNSDTRYTLYITFDAPMREDMYGIYKSWYRNNYNEEIRWMATTQFQATAARFAFPCYDEPSFKATFDITIRRPTTFKSWSCTRIKETNNTIFGNYQDDIYHTTPQMSTYLLALIVAEYDSLNATDANGRITHEVIARPGAIQLGQGEYAMRVGQNLLSRMSAHTDYDFYSQNENLKMTQAAIPDFGAGAMENWGLLTYREAYLMLDEVHTNGHFQQLIAYILSHEIAHMWFGNMVTNSWWDVLWLNEGFARYYQYFLTYWVQNYGMATRFITEQVHTSLLSDSANNPHPLTNPGVGSPASVSAMFSTISYNKGAAIIRMSEHLLGFNVQETGLRNYLRQRQFENADPIDLFNSLEQAGRAVGALDTYGPDFSFVDFFKSWTEQAGHPVLHVQVDHQTGLMTISQRRFNINTGYAVNNNNNYIVPITFTTGANPNFENTKPTHIISKAVSVIDRGVTGDHWVLFNIQQTGFYRVNYDAYTWDLIVLALRSNQRTQIHEYNRAQIVNDVFQFARSGLMTYDRAFNILSFLENETAYTPWVAAMTGFTWLRNRLAGNEIMLNKLNAQIIRWATTVMGDIGYDEPASEDFMRSYLRYQLAPVMCSLGVQACIDSATAQFNALRVNGTEVPADSRNWVYCTALRRGTQDDFNYLWTRFIQHPVYTEKILLLQTLGCTPHSESLEILLTNLVEDNYVIRPQDYTTTFNLAVSGNEGNTQIAFQFIQNRLADVIKAFGNARTPLSYISARLRTEAQVNTFQNWANTNQIQLGDAYNGVISDAELTRQSIQWTATVENSLDSYFENGDQNLETTSSTTTSAPTVVTTERPSITEPTTPSLPIPDSAVTSFVSIFALALAVIVSIIL